MNADDVGEQWKRNMESTAPVGETQERIANLIHAIQLGDRPSSLIPYLEVWLRSERTKEESLNWFQRAVRKWVL